MIEDKGFEMQSDQESTSDEINIIDSSHEQCSRATSCSFTINEVQIEIKNKVSENIQGFYFAKDGNYQSDAEESNQKSETEDEPMDLLTEKQPNKSKNKRKLTEKSKHKRSMKSRKRTISMQIFTIRLGIILIHELIDCYN